MKCFKEYTNLSEKDVFILASCADIAIKFSLNSYSKEKEEKLEFLKSLASPILDKIKSTQSAKSTQSVCADPIDISALPNIR